MMLRTAFYHATLVALCLGYLRLVANLATWLNHDSVLFSLLPPGTAKPCMIKRVQSVTAFILAGGKSSRMGRDKAFLEWEGKTLLVRSLAVARAFTEEVRIVGDAQKFSAFAPVVEDILPEHGPLGGIHAALSQGTADLNLMLAVDLPFVEPAFLTFLIS